LEAQAARVYWQGDRGGRLVALARLAPQQPVQCVLPGRRSVRAVATAR
jgi:hypothetical protein